MVVGKVLNLVRFKGSGLGVMFRIGGPRRL